MITVNILQAKSSLSRLVEAIEQGHEREILIARNGRPAAKLVPVETVCWRRPKIDPVCRLKNDPGTKAVF